MKRLFTGDWYPERLYFGDEMIRKIMHREMIIWPDYESDIHGFTVGKNVPRREVYQPICTLPMELPTTDVYTYCLQILNTGTALCTFYHEINGYRQNFSFVLESTENPDIYVLKESGDGSLCGYLAEPALTDTELEAWSASHYNAGTFRITEPWYIWVLDYSDDYYSFQLKNLPFEDPYNHIYHCTDTSISLYIDNQVYSRPYSYHDEPQIITPIKDIVPTFKQDATKWLIGGKQRHSAYRCRGGDGNILVRFGGGWDPSTSEYSVVDVYRNKNGEIITRSIRFNINGPYPENVNSVYVYSTVPDSYNLPTYQKIHVHITLDGEDLVNKLISTEDTWPDGNSYSFETDVCQLQICKLSYLEIRQWDKDADLYLKDYEIIGTALNDDKITWSSTGITATLQAKWYDEFHPIKVELNYVKNPTKWQFVRVHTSTTIEENILECLFNAKPYGYEYKKLDDSIEDVDCMITSNNKCVAAVTNRSGGYFVSYSMPEDRVTYKEEELDHKRNRIWFYIDETKFDLSTPIDIYVTSDWHYDWFQAFNFHVTIDGVEQPVYSTVENKWQYYAYTREFELYKFVFEHGADEEAFSWKFDLKRNSSYDKYYDWISTRIEPSDNIDVEKELYHLTYRNTEDFIWDKRVPLDVYIDLVACDVYKVSVQRWAIDLNHQMSKVNEDTAIFDRNYPLNVGHGYGIPDYSDEHQGYTWVNDSGEKIYHVRPLWIYDRDRIWKITFDDQQITMNDDYSFDIPMDAITKRSGQVIKIYTSTINNWRMPVIDADDGHVRFVWTANAASIWSQLENSEQDSITWHIHDAFFSGLDAVVVTYSWATDPDIPSQKALKTVLAPIHRDPQPGYNILSYDIRPGSTGTNYIVWRDGQLTYRDPAECQVLVKSVGQGD